MDKHSSSRGENDIEGGEWRPRVGSLLSDVFEVLGHRFHRAGKGSQGAERTLCKGMGSWWRDGYIHKSKSVPMKTKCRRVVSHVYCTALFGRVTWPWSVTMLAKVRAWKAKTLRLTLRPEMYAGESWVGYRKRTAKSMRTKWRQVGLPTMAEK